MPQMCTYITMVITKDVHVRDTSLSLMALCAHTGVYISGYVLVSISPGNWT